MEIARLRTLHMENPLGIDASPFFSWTLTSDRQNVVQEKYQIRVTDANGVCVWDSGLHMSSENTFIAYEGDPLKSRTRYEWTVCVQNNAGETAAGSGTFETAILNPDEWSARWAESTLPVTERADGFGNQPPATLFRKAFALRTGKKIVSARLYATARGVYQLYLNGQRADQRELAPGYSSYDSLLGYQTYDVTDHLLEGNNSIGFYVGDGWYFSQETAIRKEETKAGHHAIFFELHICYADGTEDLVCSDNQMRTSYGPVVFSDLFAGERCDARYQKTGWSAPNYDDTHWTPVKTLDDVRQTLLAAPDDVILPVKEFAVKALFEAPNGDLIADFGQNMAGKVRLHIQLPADMTVSLEHFEALGEDGNYFNTIMATNGVGAGSEQKVEYTSNGETADYTPYFTYLGFRYVRTRFFDSEGKELTGQSRPDFSAENLTAVALSTKKENLGAFSCSDEKLNQLYSNIRWSQSSNMISIPTDCPQREKAGWTGDAGIYIETALLNEDVTPFFTRWLESVKADQQDNGAIPMVVPFNETYRSMSQMMAQMSQTQGYVAPAGWGDASVKVPWTMYRVTGNREILKSSYDMMKKWCDYIIRTAEVCGRPELPREKERYLWDSGFHYGEWLIPSTSKGGFADQEAIGTAMALTGRYIAPVFGYVSISTMAETARLLDRGEDAAHYGDVAAKMKDAIQSCLIGPNGEAPAEYMGAYVLLLHYDLVPAAWRTQYEERLLEMIRLNGGCLDTGFLATPYLLETLEKIGRLDAAYDLLFQTKSPSWLYEVEHGATTIWETWNAVAENGMPQHVSMNHYSFGCVAEWMFRVIGGIRADKAGFKHMVIAPKPDPRLSWAERKYESEQGLVSCAWNRGEAGVEIQITVPCNAGATVILPDGTVHEVGSGCYRYVCQENA